MRAKREKALFFLGTLGANRLGVHSDLGGRSKPLQLIQCLSLSRSSLALHFSV